MTYEEEFKKQAEERIAEIKDETKALFRSWFLKQAVQSELAAQIREALIQQLREAGNELITGGGQDRDELMQRFEEVGLNHPVWDCTLLGVPSSDWMPQLPQIGPQPGDHLLTLPPKAASCWDSALAKTTGEKTAEDRQIEMALNTAGLFPVWDCVDLT